LDKEDCEDEDVCEETDDDGCVDEEVL